MHATTHKSSHKTHHPKSHIKRAAKRITQTKILAPIKKINKKVTNYVVKKPYQSAGIVVLLSGIVLGMVYAKLK